VHVEENSKRR